MPNLQDGDMHLTESDFGDITVIQVAAGVSSATLELHGNFYTYYWRCRFGPAEFIQNIDMRGLHDGPASSFTLLNEIGESKQIPYNMARKKIFPDLGSSSFDQDWVLIRIDGPASSWVWQYAPGTGAAVKFNSSVYRDGCLAYTGCASSTNHVANFNAANEYLADSAIESEKLLPHIDLFARYINRWEKSQ
jgi:hypothetical protein